MGKYDIPDTGSPRLTTIHLVTITSTEQEDLGLVPQIAAITASLQSCDHDSGFQSTKVALSAAMSFATLTVIFTADKQSQIRNRQEVANSADGDHMTLT